MLQPTRLDAREVVRASCDAVRPLFEDRGVVLDLEVGSEPACVEADGERLGQMVGNLLNNALKFTPPSGRVSVRVFPLGERCEILVRDSGAGIHPGDLDRIFEPFVQGAGARLSHGGMGVGLSLVKELASLQGGTVRHSSQGHGKGAEFVIALPRAARGWIRCPPPIAGGSTTTAGHLPGRGQRAIPPGRWPTCWSSTGTRWRFSRTRRGAGGAPRAAAGSPDLRHRAAGDDRLRLHPDRPASRLGRTALRGRNDRVRSARGPPAGGLRSASTRIWRSRRPSTSSRACLLRASEGQSGSSAGEGWRRWGPDRVCSARGP